jgi:hypothetical protein
MNRKNKIILTILSFFMFSLMVLPNLQADVEEETINYANTLAQKGIIVDNSKTPKMYNL